MKKYEKYLNEKRLKPWKDLVERVAVITNCDYNKMAEFVFDLFVENGYESAAQEIYTYIKKLK